ncbi:Hypothetical_protein [Hexamita inflata]|uniref:Hypothetical_protein n=1 Tax=Hexamita inflata TaxID=28002 RepID=A0AA86QA85_9EUKA|nr:Hypothetical protein HINF_LOCUS40931 [Hexamita inflata]
MCCSKCHKNKYSYILFWTCLMFLSMLSAGLVFCIVVPEPYYYDDANPYENSQYMTVGVNMCIIGFFGFVITCCVARMLHNQSVGYQQIAQDTVMGGGIAFSCLLCEQLYIKIFCHFQCG